MLSKSARNIFEYVRKKVQDNRSRKHIPDDVWRAVCVRNVIPLSAVHLHADRSLDLKFSNTLLRLPKTDSGLAILSGYKILNELCAYTGCSLEWSHEQDGLILKWGRAIYFADCYEELYILSELYFSGDYDFSPSGSCVVIDVGANVGFTSVFLANSNADILIEGYEPLKLNFEKAKKNLSANEHLANRVSFINCGLYSDNGEQTISSAVGNRGMSSLVFDRSDKSDLEVDSEIVKVKRASEVIRDLKSRYPERMLAMKMDCEGSEYAIFNELVDSGALELIDFIVMEWHRLGNGDTSLEQLKDLFSANGYHVIFSNRLQSSTSVGMATVFKAHRQV